jgi:hypothetical protein
VWALFLIDEHDLPGTQSRAQHMLDVSRKRCAIRTTAELHTRPHPAWRQRGDDGLIRRRVAGNTATGAVTNRRTRVAPRQVQIAAEFVHDHQIECVLLGDLDLKGGAQPGVALAGAQTLFY